MLLLLMVLKLLLLVVVVAVALLLVPEEAAAAPPGMRMLDGALEDLRMIKWQARGGAFCVIVCGTNVARSCW